MVKYPTFLFWFFFDAWKRVIRYRKVSQRSIDMLSKIKEIDLNIPVEFKEVEAGIRLMFLEGVANQTVFVDETKEPNANDLSVLFDGRYYSFDEYVSKFKPFSLLKPDYELTIEENENMSEGLTFAEYAFAGGSIGGLYQKQEYDQKMIYGNQKNPFKDVDIFVDVNMLSIPIMKKLLPKFLPEVENVKYDKFLSSKYTHLFDVNGIINFDYKGISFEVVFVESLIRLETFDFRFRNFFYKKGKTFATEGALEDVKNKIMRLQSHHTPTTSLVRGFVFEDIYDGYKIDEMSLKWIKWTMNEWNSDIDRIYEAVERRSMDEKHKEILTNKVKQFIGENVRVEHTSVINKKTRMYHNENAIFPFNKHLEETLKRNDGNYVTEDIYNEMINFAPNQMLEEKRVITSSYEDFVEKWKHIDAKLLTEIESFLLPSLFRQNENDILDSEFLNLFKIPFEERAKIIYSGEEYVKKNFLRFFECHAYVGGERQTLINEAVKTISEISMTISFSLETSKVKCAAENNLIVVHINGLFGEVQGVYEFRKLTRGVFTMANSSNDNKFHMRTGVFHHSLITYLKEEFPRYFDYGISSDTAKTPLSYYSREYYFTPSEDDFKVYKIKNVI